MKNIKLKVKFFATCMSFFLFVGSFSFAVFAATNQAFTTTGSVGFYSSGVEFTVDAKIERVVSGVISETLSTFNNEVELSDEEDVLETWNFGDQSFTGTRNGEQIQFTYVFENNSSSRGMKVTVSDQNTNGFKVDETTPQNISTTLQSKKNDEVLFTTLGSGSSNIIEEGIEPNKTATITITHTLASINISLLETAIMSMKVLVEDEELEEEVIKEVVADLNGGTTSSSVPTFQLVEGEEFGLTNIATLDLLENSISPPDGGVFMGWFTEKTSGDEIRQSTNVGSSFGIYARWAFSVNHFNATIPIQGDFLDLSDEQWKQGMFVENDRGEHFLYGYYPQSIITGDDLENYRAENGNGMFEMGEYVSVECTPCDSNSVFINASGQAEQFEDGVAYNFAVEPLVWRQIGSEYGNEVTCVSVIDAMSFSNSGSGTYDGSSIQNFVNVEFKEKTFNNVRYPFSNFVETTSKMDGLNNQDIYLFSADEAMKQENFSNAQRQKKATDFAKAVGVKVGSDSYAGNAYWWLRSGLMNTNFPSFVGPDGQVALSNNDVDVGDENNGVVAGFVFS